MADNDSDNESFCLVDSDNSDDDDESWSESDEEDHTVNNHNAEPLTTSEPAQELGDQSTKSPEPEDPDDKFSALQWMRTWPSSVLSMLVHTTEKSEKVCPVKFDFHNSESRHICVNIRLPSLKHW
jgi:hypothetical protein